MATAKTDEEREKQVEGWIRHLGLVATLKKVHKDFNLDALATRDLCLKAYDRLMKSYRREL